jgi:hypothetical protein
MCGLDSTGSSHGPMAGCCEHGNERLRPIKGKMTSRPRRLGLCMFCANDKLYQRDETGAPRAASGPRPLVTRRVELFLASLRVTN